jgi:malonyl-CoA O-methyltransferase
LKLPKTTLAAPKDAAVRVSAALGYRIWAETYDACPNPLLSLEGRTLFRNLNHAAGKVFVDVGCGTGRWMLAAIERGAYAIGVDSCPEMLAVARQKLPQGTCLLRADAHSLPLADSCADIVVCSFSLGYMSFFRRAISELGRIARRGGTVLVSDLHPSACEAGWRRSFRSGPRVFEIEHTHHSVGALLAAGARAGLEEDEISEPRFGEPEEVIMMQAGKAHEFSAISAIPAILAIEWRRK